MPLVGAPTIADEFKAVPRDVKNSLATRIEERRQANRPTNSNDLNPSIPDWLQVSNPQIPIPEQDRNITQSLTNQNQSVSALGQSANDATAAWVSYQQQAAAKRALAQQQALSERQKDVLSQMGNLDWGGMFPGGQVGEGKRADVLSAAQRAIGTPYRWGGGHGGTPSFKGGVDCSGLVRYAFAKAGIGKWGGQAVAATQSLYGKAAKLSSLLPGDLVVKGGRGSAHHIAIYMGNGMIIEAQRTGTTVHIRSIKGESSWTGIHLSY